MSREDNFINYLCKLADDPHDRAPLAALRRAASCEPHDLARAYPYVLPHAPQGTRQQDAYVAAASLFGLHPTKSSERAQAVSLAEAMRRVKAKSDSTEGRFLALLQSHPDELISHLRHAVTLARANNSALLWNDVLRALLFWEQGEQMNHRSPQRRWAQEFWAPDEHPANNSVEKVEGTV